MAFAKRDRGAALDDVLGINRRNLEYVYKKNLRERFKFVDDKVEAKEILSRAGLPVVETLAVIDARNRITQYLDALEAGNDFIVKPARGFGGSGVMAVRDYHPEEQREAAEFRMAAILSGMFALDSLSDRVLVERLVHEHAALSGVHGDCGVSDVRLLCDDGRAVMAMLRVPCAESAPTANLHQGGVGVGIDMATGTATYAVHHGRPITRHPDTGVAFEGLRVPHWDRIAAFGSELNRCFDLGYLGGDIVVDASHGPLILEVNARPGLAIQLANRRGLRGVLEARPDRDG